MSFFRTPSFFHSRRPFHRLRSFHLTPKEVAAQLNRSVSPVPESDKKHPDTVQPSPQNVAVPLRGATITKIFIVVSLIFISTITLAFIGGDVDDPYFRLELNKIADTTPGVVLVGESVDVDVDEPSITIRWSILACGEGFILPGSAGAHGSDVCGLPAESLYFFVDSDPQPVMTYDPYQIPFNRGTGSRRSIQNIVQFDSDHVLDVHEARLYPFDTYLLTSTLRATSFTNQTLPIRKIFTIDVTSSFNIMTTDTESYSTSANGTQVFSRDIDMRVSRPGPARTFTLLLFGVAWVLTHAAVGLVMVARRLTDMKSILKHLVSTAGILVIIPQLRNSMPDAPGLDGVLIDTIGFFPQMIVTSISIIIILSLIVGREIDIIRNGQVLQVYPKYTPSGPPSPSPAPRRLRQPPSPTANSSSTEVAQYEIYRLAKHLQGEYVFPPVRTTLHHPYPSSCRSTAHHKSKTMSKTLESGEISRWSSWVE